MDDLEKHDVPGLGTVTLRPLSYFIMEEAYKRSMQAEENERPHVFTNFALSYMLEEPSKSPEEIAKLSEDGIAALVHVVVDKWRIRKRFDNISTDLSPQKRLYQAYLGFHRQQSRRIFYYEQFNRQNKELSQRISDFHRQFNWQQKAYLDRLQKAMQRATASFGEAIGRSLEEARAASQEIGESLTQAGFWIPPSAPAGLHLILKALVDGGKATPENIRKAMVNFYDKEDFLQLKIIVSDWKTNPYFKDRMHIITDALDAHINGKYSLSIPALLPLVEGVLTDLVGKPATRADGGIRGWARDAIENMYNTPMREAYKDAFIEYLTGITVYGSVDRNYFTPQRFPAWLKRHGLSGDQVLQRHAILHGVQTDYPSKENSLRAFLLLDVLAWIKREEWDKTLQSILGRQ